MEVVVACFKVLITKSFQHVSSTVNNQQITAICYEHFLESLTSEGKPLRLSNRPLIREAKMVLSVTNQNPHILGKYTAAH